MIMSRILLAFTILAQAFGQSSSPRPLDIYSLALAEATKEMVKQYEKLGVTRQFVVDLDASPQTTYPGSANGNIFELMTRRDLIDAARKAKAGIWVIRIAPATVEGNRVLVVVYRDHVGVTKRQFNRGVSDWASVFFRLDDEGRGFQVDSVKLGGI